MPQVPRCTDPPGILGGSADPDLEGKVGFEDRNIGKTKRRGGRKPETFKIMVILTSKLAKIVAP